MQKWHMIMNDGFELTVTCKEALITRTGEEITNIKFNGIKDNIPIKLPLEECKYIYYENIEDKPSQIKK